MGLETLTKPEDANTLHSEILQEIDGLLGARPSEPVPLRAGRWY